MYWIYCASCTLYGKTLEQGTRNLLAGYIVCPHNGKIVGACDVACEDGHMISTNPHRLKKTCDPGKIEDLKQAIEKMERERFEQEQQKAQQPVQLVFFNPTASELFPQRGLYS